MRRLPLWRLPGDCGGFGELGGARGAATAASAGEVILTGIALAGAALAGGAFLARRPSTADALPCARAATTTSAGTALLPSTFLPTCYGASPAIRRSQDPARGRTSIRRRSRRRSVRTCAPCSSLHGVPHHGPPSPGTRRPSPPGGGRRRRRGHQRQFGILRAAGELPSTAPVTARGSHHDLFSRPAPIKSSAGSASTSSPFQQRKPEARSASAVQRPASQ